MDGSAQLNGFPCGLRIKCLQGSACVHKCLLVLTQSLCHCIYGGIIQLSGYKDYLGEPTVLISVSCPDQVPAGIAV